MLIIFDLDDTLIDTSGCVTPFKLKRALQIMLGSVPTPSQIDEMNTINQASYRTIEAIGTFAKNHQIGKEALNLGIAELTTSLPDDFPVRCTPHAKEILEYYRKQSPLALVTGGYAPFQLEKMEKAGIEASIFSKIAVPEDSVKKPFYQGLFREFSENPADVWVCGDRVSMDLMPAWELGFKTIHMRWGRGQRIQSAPWVDYSISDLSELRKIIP